MENVAKLYYINQLINHLIFHAWSLLDMGILHVEAARVGGRVYSLRGNIPVFVSQLHCEHVISHDRGGITKTLITFLLNILETKLLHPWKLELLRLSRSTINISFGAWINSHRPI